MSQQSVYGSVGGVAAAVGPSLGTFVVASVGWQWAFYLNFPLGMLLSGIGVSMVMPSLSGAAVSRLPADQYAVGGAINQAIRQVGSVMGVVLIVLLLGGIGLQRSDFDAVDLSHVGLALLTATLCLPISTRPT